MITVTNTCTIGGHLLFMASGSIHLTKEPRSHTAPLSYCPRCLGDNKITHRLPDLPGEDVAHGGDGFDWMEELSGWAVIAHWGHDGYDLGQWPYQILAVCQTRSTTAAGTGFGMVTYCEGDTEVTAYETQDALNDAISRYAFGVWTLAENGPGDLPADFADLAYDLQTPFEGRPLFAPTVEEVV